MQPRSVLNVDLFRSRREQITNMRHELGRLAGLVDWSFFDGGFSARYATRWDTAVLDDNML